MAAPVAPDSYKELILFLATAGVVVPLFHRLKVSPVLGFLAAGALLGPYGLGRLAEPVTWLHLFTIANSQEVSHLAEFGVVFLLFTIGIELSWERLRVLRRLVFGLGAAQVVACAAALAGLAALVGAKPGAAVLIGLALALSSTAIAIPVLAEGRRLNAPAGRASFSILLFQDLAVAPILFAVGVLGTADNGDFVTDLLWALLQAAIAIAVILGLGRLALRPLFQLVASTRSPELFMAASLLVVITTAVLAAASGLSMALGAFMAGLLLAETEYRRAIEAMIEPFKGLLLGVFFVSVGMNLDVLRLAESPLGILVAAGILVATKGVIVAALSRLFGQPTPVAVETALPLSAGGEFAFVILGSAMALDLVPRNLGQAGLIVVTVTMVAIPGLARLGQWLGGGLAARTAPTEPVEPPPPDEAGHVIVAGFGRVGMLVGEMLARHQVPYLAIDANPQRCLDRKRLGLPVYVGDSTSPEFLRACGVERARALVVTLDRPLSVEAVVQAARLLNPNLTIVARARDARHASELYRLGVNDAVPETIEASLQLSEAVLVDIGVPMGLVIASIHERRDEFRKVLTAGERPAASAGSGQFRSRRTVGKRSA